MPLHDPPPGRLPSPGLPPLDPSTEGPRPFRDRTDAGRRLADHLITVPHGPGRGDDVVVLGLPRGGVPVAAEVARALGAPLDVIVVRKLGVPWQPELAMGALGEGGVLVLDQRVLRATGVGPEELGEVEQREAAELAARALRLRGDRPPVPLAGHTALIVDDGVATGSTALAACKVARERGASGVVLAVPVAPPESLPVLRTVADDVVALLTPEQLVAVGEWYEDFTPTTDEQVRALLAQAPHPARPAPPPSSAGSTGPVPQAPPDQAGPVRDEEVLVDSDTVVLPGHLSVPAGVRGAVVFTHGSGSSRHSPRNLAVARSLGRAKLATLLLDLLSPLEEADRANVFDVELRARRLAGATRWVRAQPGLGGLGVGWFGASTGAAAALRAAAEPDADVHAVVSRGGRPDLAGAALAGVRAPTLLVVGGHDEQVLALNRRAQQELRCPNELVVVPGATHLFEEPGALDAVAALARGWFLEHLPLPAPRG
ncbi:MAG: phosphoribosyltransferase family protein [Motilibacteraceae bacterium]